MGKLRVKRLAFVYHPRSFATMEISAAAEGVCDLIWVVDQDLGETPSMVRLLRRLGEVVDVTGLDHDAAAARIAAARPDGILALHDRLLTFTAEVAARLQLPFHAPTTAERLSDKRAQRAALAAAGLQVPWVLSIPPQRERLALRALLGAARFPAVLKPRFSESSRNTLPIANRHALVEALDAIARATPADRDALQLEEYLADRPGATTHGDVPADYVSVETAVVDGVVRHLAITGRFPLAAPFRETGFFLPAALPADEEQAVLALATAAVRACGVTGGCLHTEIKMTPAGPVVIEVNGRIGGGVPDLLRRATGLELMPIALRLALGARPDLAPLPPADGVAFVFLRQAPQRLQRITTVDGLDALRALPGVDQVILNRGPGADVDWRAGTEEHVFAAEGLVPDHVTLLEVRRAVEHDVLVTGAAEDDDAPPLRYRALASLNALTVLSTLPLVA